MTDFLAQMDIWDFIAAALLLCALVIIAMLLAMPNAALDAAVRRKLWQRALGALVAAALYLVIKFFFV